MGQLRHTLTLACLALLACQHERPPSQSEPPTTQKVVATSSARTPTVAASATRPSAEAVSADASAEAAPPPKPVSAVPPVVDDAGAPLPQTEDRPSTTSAFFEHLKQTLFAAIQNDDPALARELFFPIEGYRQVKAIAKPDRDYERRLLKAYERDIHAYHKKLGKDPRGAKLVALDVPEARAKWMKPGSEGNKLGYFRVLRSQLRFLDASGKERSLEITSLISWRGEWYVVHVNGFE